MEKSDSTILQSKIANQDAWDIACRWHQYEAEIRVNVVRILAVSLFYLVHLMNYYSVDGYWHEFLQLNDGSKLSSSRHLGITSVVVAWIMYGFGVQLLLQDKVFPKRLPVLSISIDNLLLTSVLLLSNGAASPIVAGYFLIIIMSGLRLNLAWVWLASLGAVCGYLFILGATRWPQGMLVAEPLPAVLRYHQLMIVLALGFAGALVGQLVRHVRRVAAHVASLSNNGKRS